MAKIDIRMAREELPQEDKNGASRKAGRKLATVQRAPGNVPTVVSPLAASRPPIGWAS